MKIFKFTPIFNFQNLDIIKNHKQIIGTSKYEILSADIVGASVEHAKAIIYKKFLETDCTHFFNVDADILFLENEINPIDKLVELDKDIVGGIYVYKKLPCFPTHRPLDLQEIYEREGKFPEDYKFVIPQELHEVKWLAGGCMIIKREVIEKLMEKYPVPNLPMIHKEEYLSEDFAFCERARKLGYKIYAEPTIKLGHCGSYFFFLKDYYEKTY